MTTPTSLSRFLVVAGAAAGLLLTACITEGTPATKAPPGPKFAATVRIDSAAKGIGVKVNGTLVATQLPADVAFDVTEAGRSSRVYRIALNRNATPPSANMAPDSFGSSGRPGEGDQVDTTSVTIDIDQPLPSRIYFDTSGPQITGTAVIDRVR